MPDLTGEDVDLGANERDLVGQVRHLALGRLQCRPPWLPAPTRRRALRIVLRLALMDGLVEISEILSRWVRFLHLLVLRARRCHAKTRF